VSKIIVQGLLDPALQAWAHSGHFLDLYLFFIKGMVEQEKTKESESPLLNEPGNVYGSWALEEVYKVGLVTLYHHWEKSIKKLMKDQSAAQGLQLIRNNDRVSFVDHVKRNLESVFDCVVENSIWAELNETRLIVNCYKHGTSEKFYSLYETYPNYFDSLHPGDDIDYSDHFLLGENNLERLGKNIQTFWETLPRETTFG